MEDRELANASQPASFSKHLFTFCTGVIPINLWNEIAARGEEEESVKIQETPLFGTHIKEAVAVIKGERKK